MFYQNGLVTNIKIIRNIFICVQHDNGRGESLKATQTCTYVIENKCYLV